MPVLGKLIRYHKWELLFVKQRVIGVQSMVDTDYSAEGSFLISGHSLGREESKKKVLRKREKHLTANREW